MATVLITQCPGSPTAVSGPDQGIPGLADALEIVRWCREATPRGQTVVVTRMGGPGRSGTLTIFNSGGYKVWSSGAW
jgi:protein-tyrosine phosphatase